MQYSVESHFYTKKLIKYLYNFLSEINYIIAFCRRSLMEFYLCETFFVFPIYLNKQTWKEK